MSALTFRNLDISPASPVRDWPYEAIVTAIERGMLSDWRRLAREVDACPWGHVARSIEAYASYAEDQAAADLLAQRVRLARESARTSEEREVAERVRAAITRSGMTARDFARHCGTSATRLSTYSTGKVVPSAAMLVRLERAADRRAGTPTPALGG